jgi:hypothetical protein
MNQDERSRVIHGQVHYQDQWVLIEEKDAREREMRKRLDQGYVLFQGEWVTIDEKLARESAQSQPQMVQQNIYNNPVINPQVYNIQANTDSRSYSQTSEEQRHIHVSPGESQPAMWEQQQQNFSQFLNQQFAQPGSQGQVPQQQNPYFPNTQQPEQIGQPQQTAYPQQQPYPPQYQMPQQLPSQYPGYPPQAAAPQQKPTPPPGIFFGTGERPANPSGPPQGNK